MKVTKEQLHGLKQILFDEVQKATDHRFQTLWFYKDWTDRFNQEYDGDLDVDLVGEDKDGSLCAIKIILTSSTDRDEISQDCVHEAPEWATTRMNVAITKLTKSDIEVWQSILQAIEFSYTAKIM